MFRSEAIMADLRQQVRAWLHAQPDWLQHAAEIVLSSGDVTEPEVQALVERLKSPEGQRTSSHRTFDGLNPTPVPVSALRLLEIGEVRGIENLGPRTPLSFGNGNLCVIYGHNGSGKSGYTRLLKRVSGHTGSAALRPNVFQTVPPNRQAAIKYEIAGSVKQVQWPADAPPIDDLRAVDIFDGQVASSYLTEETSASYTPPLVALFEVLARVCDRVKWQLQSEQNQLVSALPALPSEYAATPAAIAYRSLRANLAENAIKQIVKWDASDGDALERLADRLKADDPAALARQKRDTMDQVRQLSDLLIGAAAALSDERLTSIRTLRVDAENKRRIASESAQVTSARLTGVGSDTWRAMWEAARAYSQTAYPERAYPVTEEALCLLCHQELAPDAGQRLRDFEEFVRGRVESDAAAAEALYEEAVQELPAALPEQDIVTRCQAAGLTDESWRERLRDFWKDVGGVRDAVQQHEVGGLAAAVASPTQLVEDLATRLKELEREAVQFEQDATAFDRPKAIKEKDALEAQRWLSQQASAVRAEVLRLRQVAEYDTWMGLANSRPVSLKAGEISEKVVTEAFIARFNRELTALGASRLRVVMSKTRIQKGQALHRLQLKGARSGQDLPDLVLSEGERRVVSLAAFLADVSEQPSPAPFVFDDPISSLDHDFEWFVATRLAQLAQSRQVLVFTHRLSLYGAMEDAAKKVGVSKELLQLCIETFAGAAGQPADQAAWNANTGKANNILLSRLDDAKKAGAASGAQAYQVLAQAICSDFRKLLERTVEDDLLNSVVRRHRRSVTTDNRLAQLSTITRGDCEYIDALMTKYSAYEHSQSQEAPVTVPDEAELRKDLEELKRWREDFKKRPT